MAGLIRKHLYLPAKDRSFWKADAGAGLPLLYLAWGHRDFREQGVPVSTHEGWVCVCIEEGSPTLLLRDRPVRISRGQVVFLREDCPFGWQQGEEGNCKFLLWMWRRPLHPGLAELPPNTVSIHKIPAAQRQFLATLHGMCREEIRRLDPLSAGWLESCQRQMEVVLLRLFHPVPEEKADARRVALALAWMREHPESREPVARLCDYLGVSQPTLHRLFTGQTGGSPLAHFQRIKMEHARRLLAEADPSIKEVAFALGYRHFNDFSRAYRRHFGHPPSQAR